MYNECGRGSMAAFTNFIGNPEENAILEAKNEENKFKEITSYSATGFDSEACEISSTVSPLNTQVMKHPTNLNPAMGTCKSNDDSCIPTSINLVQHSQEGKVVDSILAEVKIYQSSFADNNAGSSSKRKCEIIQKEDASSDAHLESFESLWTQKEKKKEERLARPFHFVFRLSPQMTQY